MDVIESIFRETKTAEGRQLLISSGNLDKLVSCFKELRYNGCSDVAIVTMRAFRNACSGVVGNAANLEEKGVVLDTFTMCKELFWSKCLTEDSELNQRDQLDDELKSKEDFFLASCQFIANFTNCSDQYRAYLWSPPIGSSRLCDLIACAASSRNSKCLEAAMAIIYNSLASAIPSKLSDNNIQSLCDSRALVCQMLLSVVSHKYTQGRKSGDDSAEVSSIANTLPLLTKGPVELDPASEWLHLLVHLLTCRGKLLDVFRLVGPKRSHEGHASVWEVGPKVKLLSVAVADEETGPYQKTTQCSSSGHGISHEQVIVLQLGLDVLEDPDAVKELAAAECAPENLSGGSVTPLGRLGRFLLELARLVRAELGEGINSSTGAGAPDEYSALLDTDPGDGDGSTGGFVASCSDAGHGADGDASAGAGDASSGTGGDAGAVAGTAAGTDDGTSGGISGDVVGSLDGDTEIAQVQRKLQQDSQTLLMQVVAAGLSIFSNCNAAGRAAPGSTVKDDDAVVDKAETAVGGGGGGGAVVDLDSSVVGRRLREELVSSTEIMHASLSLLGRFKQSDAESARGSSRGAKAAGASRTNSIAGESADDMRQRQEKEQQEEEEKKNKELQEKEDRNEGVKAALRLLCNLLFRCPPAQDKLHELGGIPLILSYCATDFSNPFSREWALLCVRNACEGNARNQAFIESLQLQKTDVVNEGLKKSGISVDIQPGTGTFRFVHRDNSSSNSSNNNSSNSSNNSSNSSSNSSSNTNSSSNSSSTPITPVAVSPEVDFSRGSVDHGGTDGDSGNRDIGCNGER